MGIRALDGEATLFERTRHNGVIVRRMLATTLEYPLFLSLSL